MTHAFGRYAVIVAHPDDEILWTGSLLRDAECVIICFGPAKEPFVAAGRERALKKIPLANLVCLNIPEAGVFGLGRWSHPQRIDYGLQLNRLFGSRSNVSQYEKNYNRIRKALEPLLGDLNTVVTHNPWGDYGNEEHVQVHSVVSKIAGERGLALWVTSCVSSRSARLFEKERRGISGVSDWFSTDQALCAEVSKIYKADDCWTWVSGWEWPEREFFLRFEPEGRNKESVGTVPIRYLPWPVEPPRSIAHSVARKIKKKAFAN